MKLAEIRKYLVAAGTVLSQVLALGVLPSPLDHYVILALGVLGALGVYQVPNEPATEK